MSEETDPPLFQSFQERAERHDRILAEIYDFMERGQTKEARDVIAKIEDHDGFSKALWMIADKMDGKIAIEVHPLPENWAVAYSRDPENPNIVIIESKILP
jgi:hypothetical protein